MVRRLKGDREREREARQQHKLHIQICVSLCLAYPVLSLSLFRGTTVFLSHHEISEGSSSCPPAAGDEARGAVKRYSPSVFELSRGSATDDSSTSVSSSQALISVSFAPYADQIRLPFSPPSSFVFSISLSDSPGADGGTRIPADNGQASKTRGSESE